MYDHDYHHFPFPEGRRELFRRRLCMTMTTTPPLSQKRRMMMLGMGAVTVLRMGIGVVRMVMGMGWDGGWGL